MTGADENERDQGLTDGRIEEVRQHLAQNRAAVEGTMDRISGQLAETKAQLATDRQRINQTGRMVKDTQARLNTDEDL